MVRRWILGGFVLALAALPSCAWLAPGLKKRSINPDERLDQCVQALDELRSSIRDGKTVYDDNHVAIDPARIRNEIESLASEFPNHAPTLAACACLSYEAGERERAQMFLDALFRAQSAHPECAVLRARIAIEDGNLRFARRLLEEQIRLTPNHSGLREAHAAALYLQGELDAARDALATAGRLGAPSWRVAYHRGLIEEAAGNAKEAEHQYQLAVDQNPQWAAAAARLEGLQASENRSTSRG